ncbi:glycosyltransferase [Lentzea flaviverrucosa]|uniref:Glycosyltransferase involved in cell wall bisynthesis n=1 Tax=Lentzea flaviverrucosa TaxID=200379 RepID=A0A1H9XT72_9PSEU|nr:glycosyltransferase [Lentzea flaviverrucosa]RDI19211.1 glycosyltransferase involved in cell wall biosynthesis [Lentzea flaviverrucosa]SES49385.1 Glycosyltransferase involved in cell wall bisynthesis [Lentzea flaviverrucosa]
MRVLHVISEMGAGGAEALVAGMALAGGDVGWESAVASGGGFRADALRAGGVPVFAVPVARRSPLGVVRAAWAVRVAVRRFRPDVVVAHNVSASLVARLASPRRPVVTVFHGVAEADVPGAVKVLRRVSTVVVTVAAAAAARLRDAGLGSVVVIPNAVFPSEPTADRATVRARLGTPLDVPVALCPARLEPQKRHDVLLDAWAQIPGDCELWLAGDGSLRAELEARAPGRVRFLGTRTDVRDLLEAADVTVLTSDWEGMPIALLESLAAVRPVVASDVDGVREVLSGGGGVLVPRRSPGQTAKALRGLLFSPAARSVAASHDGSADAHTLMKSYDELLRTVLEGR